jgi:hypothetical protein
MDKIGLIFCKRFQRWPLDVEHVTIFSSAIVPKSLDAIDALFERDAWKDRVSTTALAPFVPNSQHCAHREHFAIDRAFQTHHPTALFLLYYL